MGHLTIGKFCENAMSPQIVGHCPWCGLLFKTQRNFVMPCQITVPCIQCEKQLAVEITAEMLAEHFANTVTGPTPRDPWTEDALD